MIAALISLLAAVAQNEPAIVDAVKQFIAAFEGSPAPTPAVSPEVQGMLDPILAELRAKAGK